MRLPRHLGTGDNLSGFLSVCVRSREPAHCLQGAVLRQWWPRAESHKLTLYVPMSGWSAGSMRRRCPVPSRK